MIDDQDIKNIRETVSEFFQKLTLPVQDINIEHKAGQAPEDNADQKEVVDSVTIEVRLDEPQILIGQNGQTLFDLNYLLRIMLAKKLGKFFYVYLDINDYKKNKIEYIKKIANDSVSEALAQGKPITLPTMSSYERRIVHTELESHKEVIVESQGEGAERRIVISPK